MKHISKIYFLTYLLLVAGLSGCINERYEIPGESSNRPVIFSPKPDVKAADTRALPGHPVENIPGQSDAGMIPDNKSFGVYAWVKPSVSESIENFAELQNMEVTRNGAQCSYAPIANWPKEQNATLSFFGYYPHLASADADGRIATTRGNGSNQWMRIAYTISQDAGKHIDLMYAKTPMTTGYDPVNLNFKHALARLKFEGRTDGYPSGAQVKITGIKVKGATLQGEMVVLDPATQPGKPWWELDDAVKGDMFIPAAHINDIVLSESLQAVIPAGGDMLVLPQQVSGLSIEITLSQDGTDFLDPILLTLDGTPDWTMNEIFTYEISVSPSGVFIAAKVDEWSTDPVGVVYDGQWWLSVDEDEYRFGTSGGEFSLTAETNYNIDTQGYPAGLQIDASETVYEPAVTPGNEWLTLTDVTGTDGDLAREIKIAAGNNTVGDRTAKIKIQAGNLTKIVNVTQVYVPPKFPAYPGVIGYDPASKTLNLNGVGVMVYFKFGSIIAMYASNDSPDQAWNGASTIAFNPWPDKDYDFSNYLNFPDKTGVSGAGTNTTVGNVNIDEVFHKTVANAQNGNGDPCRFIKDDGTGMTAIEVQTALQSGSVPDQGIWRLPTHTENGYVAFSPVQSAWVTKASPSDPATQRNGHTFSGLNKGGNHAEGWNFLPAASNRFTSDGTIRNQGSFGYFWSSTPISATNGYGLYFSGNSVYTGNNGQSIGFAVRCVRQP